MPLVQPATLHVRVAVVRFLRSRIGGGGGGPIDPELVGWKALAEPSIAAEEEGSGPGSTVRSDGCTDGNRGATDVEWAWLSMSDGAVIKPTALL